MPRLPRLTNLLVLYGILGPARNPSHDVQSAQATHVVLPDPPQFMGCPRPELWQLPLLRLLLPPLLLLLLPLQLLRPLFAPAAAACLPAAAAPVAAAVAPAAVMQRTLRLAADN